MGSTALCGHTNFVLGLKLGCDNISNAQVNCALSGGPIIWMLLSWIQILFDNVASINDANKQFLSRISSQAAIQPQLRQFACQESLQVFIMATISCLIIQFYNVRAQHNFQRLSFFFFCQDHPKPQLNLSW